MQWVVKSSGKYVCDLCSTRADASTPRFSCKACNYDVCRTCAMNAEKLLRPEPVTGKNVTAAPTSRREVAAAAPTNVIEPAALAVRPPKQKTVAAAAPTINVAVAPREVAAAAPTNVIEPAALAVRPPKQKTVAAARREVAAAAPTNDIEPAAFAFRLPKQKTFAAAAPTIDVAVAPTPPDAAVATAAVDNAANETPPPVVDEHQLSLVRTHASVALARSARAQLVDLLAARRIASDVETSSGSFEFLRSLRAVSEPARETIDVFDGLQQRLRDAIEIDDELVKQRDDARASLVHAANALVAAFDAVGADAMADARGNLQRCASAVGAWPCSSDAGGDGSAWILDAESRVRQVSDETDKRVGELMSALAALASAFSADSEWYDSGAARHATATVRACAVAAECECSVIKQLRVPHDVSSALHNRIKSQLAQLDDIVALVDRARGARMCEAPDGGRLLAAQRSLKQARKQVAFAEAELAHADDDDDHDDLAASLAKCKAARAAAVDEESAAVLALGAAMNDFPELVLRFPSARLDVLSMSVVGGEATTNGTLRTLDAYDQRVELASARNVVERASIGGVSCALKLFALGEHGKRAFLKEARQLRQLAHPNVVELRAAFIDNKSTRELVGVIEMPLYEHGSLWAWLSAADRGGVAKIGVLRQTLCGLEHVHRMGVVHGDVKPDNVFVDGAGVAKLGDFDVSHQQDSATRTMTRIGVTDAYCAPELEPKLWAQRTPQPSKASDVFALGLTMFDIMCSQQTLQRPVALDMLREHELVNGENQVRSLVGALTALEPSKRPSATAALMLGAFAPPPPGRDPVRDRRACVVCFDNFWAHEGLECDAAHFLCAMCIGGCVSMIASKPIAHVAPLRCGAHKCGHEFGHARVAATIPEATFASYIAKLNEVQESRMHQKWQLRMQAELAAQERKLRGELSRAESIASHRRHVCEQLLCLRCPQCACVFVDFSDCFALACSRCNTRFCAWCLVNCGGVEAAHRHVAVCALNTSVPRGVFGSASQFEMCHRERRTRLVREYVRGSVPDELRADVLAALAKDLSRLRVRIE